MTKSLTITARIPLPESILEAAPVVEKAKAVIEKIQALLKEAGFDAASVDEARKRRGPGRDEAPMLAATLAEAAE